VYYWYQPDLSEKADVFFDRCVLTTTFIASCLWGSSMLLMNYNSHPAETIFLNIVICALVSSSIGIASFWIQYFWAYTFPMLCFYSVNFLIGIPETNVILFFSALWFFLFLRYTAGIFYQRSIENIVLRSRNQSITEKLSKQMDKAEKTASSRSEFLASASHDLRQPLQAINSYLAALQPHLNSAEGDAIYHKLEHSADSMNDLLGSLLDISRLDSDTLQLNMRAVSIDHIANHLEQIFRMQADQKNVALSLQHGKFWVHSDAMLLERILSNLISNAINYTASGKVSLICHHRGSCGW
jgi:signal transduction histidine kinase